MPYPVSIAVEPTIADRNRWTTGFRLILAIPHLILAGGIGFSLLVQTDRPDVVSLGPETGILGAIAGVAAVVSLVHDCDRPCARRRAPALHALLPALARARARLRDAARRSVSTVRRWSYPASVTVVDPVVPRDRLSVGLRVILVIPHFIVLAFLLPAWWLVTVLAWCLVLASGRYPQGLYHFAVACFQWYIRVEAYMLLLVDEYPPFTFE